MEPTAWPAVSSITITTPDGVELAGALYLPSHRPAPGVLLLHMLGRQKEDWEELALRLQAEGYAVLAMDLRGHGASGGEVDWAAAVGDLGLAWATLSGHTDVDGDRTAILGASIGANLALVTAANTSRVVTVVLLSPGLDYRVVKTEEAMATYGTRSVLIVASEEDTYAAESSRVLDGLAQGEHRLVMYQGAGHGTQMFDPQPELADEIVSWLDTYLRE